MIRTGVTISPRNFQFYCGVRGKGAAFKPEFEESLAC